MEDPVLIANEGPLNGQQWVLKGQILIGRDAACDIVIPDRQVSRQHARISNTGKGIILEDLGSKNGTFVNNKPIFEEVKLAEADEIQIALTQTFLFLSSDATLPLSDLPPELSQVLTLRLEPVEIGRQRHRLDAHPVCQFDLAHLAGARGMDERRRRALDDRLARLMRMVGVAMLAMAAGMAAWGADQARMLALVAVLVLVVNGLVLAMALAVARARRGDWPGDGD